MRSTHSIDSFENRFESESEENDLSGEGLSVNSQLAPDSMTDNMDCDMSAPGATTCDFSGHMPEANGRQHVITQHPFHGDYKTSTWNTQALFAVNTHRQFPKKRRVTRIIHESDVTFLQETHSQPGSAMAWTPPDGHIVIWSHGTSRVAGVGIALKHSFLSMFNPIDVHSDVLEIIPGRVLLVHLHGPCGNLDLCCVYMDAHETSVRKRAITKLARFLSPAHKTLTIMGGDWTL